ncbi:LOW QUALITY PROTEIN: uncharacterized protein LOC132921702, partial [Rhopalosiphum padi]|uniref:LOW QUALITY PROTEIN: uncharacterized protein LOC132921702 n=1 Tax=Rhopalosiphum padi TaxID=40932 RepID=UPI00298EA0BC
KIDAALHATAEPRHSQFTCDDEDRSGISRSKMFFGMVCSVCIFLMPYSLSAMPVNGLLRFTYPAYVYPAYLAVPMMHFVGQWPTDDHAFVSLANRRFTYRILLAAALTMQQLCDSLLRLVPLYCLIKTAFFAPIEANGAAYVYAVVVRAVISTTRINPYKMYAENNQFKVGG